MQTHEAHRAALLGSTAIPVNQFVGGAVDVDLKQQVYSSFIIAIEIIVPGGCLPCGESLKLN